MDWGEFWTLVLQFLISCGIVAVVGFVGTAIYVAVKEGMQERK